MFRFIDAISWKTDIIAKYQEKLKELDWKNDIGPMVDYVNTRNFHDITEGEVSRAFDYALTILMVWAVREEEKRRYKLGV
jgi:hypothetical protein